MDNQVDGDANEEIKVGSKDRIHSVGRQPFGTVVIIFKWGTIGSRWSLSQVQDGGIIKLQCVSDQALQVDILI